MVNFLLRHGAVVVAVALLLVAPAVWAQSAGLLGTVVDSSHSSIAGAEVKVTNEAEGAVRTATTESDGRFVFTQLPPGKYKLEVSAAGFKTSVRPHVELPVGITTTLDVRLEVGTVAQVVEVTSGVVALNTTDASIGTPISGSELNSLPVLDMNPAGLLGLQTGVAYIPTQADHPGGYGGTNEQDGRSGAVNGARSDQNNVTLDGIDVNDAQKGYAFTSVLRTPQDALAEFRTTTTSYDAESGGRSSGAQVELVTKSGTNSIHGSAYYSHRNEAFNANDFFLNRQDIKQPKFRHHLYGGSLGGPIIKDRVFLFGDYERLKESLFSSAVRAVPSVAFKDGVFFYPCTTVAGAPNKPCPTSSSGFVQGMSGMGYGMDSNSRPCRQTDAGCGPVQAGYYALSPAEVTSLDPESTDPSWTGPVGPNPAVLAYDQTLPDPNDSGSFDGLNILGYRFGAPVSNLYNTAVVRLDVKVDQAGKHTLFWRGNLMHDTVNDAPQFPGQAPKSTSLNNNKGFSLGYTALITNNLVNSFHYGLTRISEKTAGVRNSQFVMQRFIDDLAGFWDANSETRSHSFGRILPQHHFRDDVSWTKGVHTWSFGGEFRMTRNATFDNLNSFPTFLVNPSWTPDGGSNLIPGGSSCLPAGIASFEAGPGCTVVPLNGGGACSFTDGLTELLAPISDTTAYYNFDKTGAASAEGAPVKRRFGVNEYELYAQDKWRIKPSLTLTLGARYYIGSPPWETNGEQVAPTPSFGDWFDCRQKALLAAQSTDQMCGLITTDLAGPANHKPGYYAYDFKDVSPRVALAWSPQFKDGVLHSVFGEGKSSIRAGYSMVYDRIGNGLATSFDQIGSFGLSTSIESFFGGCGIGHEGAASAGPCVRFSGNSDTAPVSDATNICGSGSAAAPCLAPNPGGGFPATPPQGLLTVTNGIDNRIKSPYAHTLDLSFSRELPGHITLETAYVGRLAHRLTMLRDLAMPADIHDSQSGMTAFQAAKVMQGYASKNNALPDQGFSTINPSNVGAFWQDIFPAFGPTGSDAGCLVFNTFNIGTNADGSAIAPGNQPCGYSATQVAYDYMMFYHGTHGTPGFGAVTFWQDVDYFATPANASCSGSPVCPGLFFPSQYVGLNTWTTTGYSFYHALQVILRKEMTHGLSFVLNYTFSHSLDTSSSPERQDIIGGQTVTGGYSGIALNAWNIREEYANSDFDIRHQFNGYWIAELPFGKGKWIGRNSSSFLDHLIGGWQLSGIVHANSAPPLNVVNGRTWPTNWDLQGNAVCAPQGAYPLGVDVGPCPSTQTVHGATHSGGGQPVPNAFANPDFAVQFFRYAATGERGQRNQLRADSYFSTDVSLAKTIKMGERVSLLFHWDVFNLTNSAYFDAANINASLSHPETFGDYTQMLGRPRQMQGSLKLIF